MFTGIIEDIGTITTLRTRRDVVQVEVRTAIDLSTVKLGDSVAVDGVCLTVTHVTDGHLTFDAGPETRAVSTLNAMKSGRRVHLERAMQLGGRLDGHLVSGHVDALGTIAKKKSHGETVEFTIALPKSALALCIPKGSICLDGVSLTINSLDASGVSVWLVPHSLGMTHLGDKSLGDPLNVETDLIGKYVQRLFAPHAPGGVSWAMLEKHGFGRERG